MHGILQVEGLFTIRLIIYEGDLEHFCTAWC